jgi:hypothetical protein
MALDLELNSDLKLRGKLLMVMNQLPFPIVAISAIGGNHSSTPSYGPYVHVVTISGLLPTHRLDK